MTSHILQFLLVQRQKGDVVNALSHAVVVVLTEPEKVIVEGVCEWLTERKKELSINIQATTATGGDLTTIDEVLKVVADQYGYAEYTEDCPTLAGYGINRTALVP